MYTNSINNSFWLVVKSLAVLLLLIISGCGGESMDTQVTQTILVPDCNITTPVYEVLLSNDEIIADLNNTRVEILHDQNGDKKVCTISGKAYIYRK